MNFSIQKNESYTYIRVNNEKLDALMAPVLKSELILIVENGEKNILTDLSGCNYCDSSGLSALLLGNRLCGGADGRFVVSGLSDGVRKIMDLAGLNALLLIADTRKEAEALF